jgi:hypothetical protein
MNNFNPMQKFLFSLLICLPWLATGQQPDSTAKARQSDPLYRWLEDLNEKGLEIDGDSIIMGKEFQRALQDENYRKLIFPDNYSWEKTILFIQEQDLKKAFWYMINLYPQSETNKELVVKSVVTYDKLFKMDELLVNTFYTYSYLDPQVSQIVDGIPEIVRPDIQESKLADVREIIRYIQYFRDNPIEQKKPETAE